MPVRRFTHPDGMRVSRWLDPGDPRIASRLRSVLDTGRLFMVIHRPRGVRRFRSIEELNAARKAWGQTSLVRPLDPPESAQ